MAELAPGMPLEVIPHHAGAPPAAVAGVTREEARRRLKLPTDGFLVGHFGFITRPKQPEAVVKGFAVLHAEDPSAKLVLVGADNTGGGLERLIDRVGVRDAVRHAGFVDLERFYLYLRAVDAVVNLRYPSAGESVRNVRPRAGRGQADDREQLRLVRGGPSRRHAEGRDRRATGGAGGRAPPAPPARAGLPGRDRGERAEPYATTVLDPVRCRDLYVDFAARVAGTDVRQPV